MSADTIFWPVLIQIALTVVIYIRLGMAKAKAIKTTDVDRSKTALDNDAWPDFVRKYTNNLRNQFELPVLFYALVIVTWAIGAVNLLSLILAWVFALSRIVHAYVHTGSNHVPTRLKIFLLGCVALIAMLVHAAVMIML